MLPFPASRFSAMFPRYCRHHLPAGGQNIEPQYTYHPLAGFLLSSSATEGSMFAKKQSLQETFKCPSVTGAQTTSRSQKSSERLPAARVKQGHRANKFQCGSIRRIEVRGGGGLGTLRMAGRCCKYSYNSPSSIHPPQPDGQPRGSAAEELQPTRLEEMCGQEGGAAQRNGGGKGAQVGRPSG